MNKFLFILFLSVGLLGVQAQERYIPSQSNLDNRAWFEASRLGIFIHWGVYSTLGDGEWVMNNQNFAVDEYNLLPRFFNPLEFNARKWAKLFKQSGAKYITFTTRHHDGFSMWNSKVSNYNISKATPYKRDITKELVNACRAEGIKVMFYYSLLDWGRNDYLPAGKTGQGIVGRDTTKGDWRGYIDFMKAQLTELLTQYGRIDGIWFDGHWDKPDQNWHYDELYKLIHQLQPHCLIGNNHHLAPFEGEDFQMFERDLPGENTTGFGTSADHVGKLPKEVCGTIAGSWGFDIKDRNQKTFKEVLHYLVKAAGSDANLLLNVGPLPNGEIQEYQQDRLKELGAWLAKYGETIYETRGAIVMPHPDYALTKNDKNTFIHVLNGKAGTITIKGYYPNVYSLVTYSGDNALTYSQTPDGLQIEVPQSMVNEHDLILKLTEQ